MDFPKQCPVAFQWPVGCSYNSVRQQNIRVLHVLAILYMICYTHNCK